MGNLTSAILSLCLGVFFAAVWLDMILFDSETLSSVSSLVGFFFFPLAAAFFLWLAYKTLLRKREINTEKEQIQKQLLTETLTLEKASACAEADFVKLIATLFERLGYRVDAGNENDRGAPDLVLTKNDRAELVLCLQNAERISTEVVNEFLDVISSRRATGGYIVTTGQFTLPARQYARDRHLNLVDGPELAELLSSP